MSQPRQLHGRKIAGGCAVGEVLLSAASISFFGGVDPQTGVVCEPGHPLEGRCIAGRVLAFPSGKGSTVGSYSLYRLAKAGRAPAALLNAQCETIVAVGAIISAIPCLDQLSLVELVDGARVEVDADRGLVTLLEGA